METITRVAVAMMLSVANASGQTFSPIITETVALGEMEHVFVVADLNGDALDDIVVGDQIDHDPDFTPADRLMKVPLHVFTSDGDGTFTHAPELVDGQIEAHAAVVVAGDFNGDGRNDLVVYDHGAYIDSASSGHGNPPQLFLSSDGGVLRPSDDLANAVKEQHEREPPPNPPAAPSDLHLKIVTTGDLENDGDVDIWVESDGGNNMKSHFAVNNGDGTFTLDIRNRATDLVHHNSPPTWWRYHEALFMDVDHDGDSDLVLGQLRDPSRLDQFSIILVNDGNGYFPTRTELPHPEFNDGVTRVFGIARFDLNRDGADDMLMLHVRNGLAGGWSGRFIQALLNTGDGSFVDETSTWIPGDQSVTAIEGYNLGGLAMHDVDLDGCLDLVVTAPWDAVRPESPLVYRNNGSGQFSPLPPEHFVSGDESFGYRAMRIDANGDGAIDFVASELGPGADGTWETDDDSAQLVTLLNTTPAGPVRCRPRVTAAGTLPPRTLYVGAGAVAVVVSVANAFRHASTWRAASSAPGVATVSVSGSDVTVTPVAATGVATITVTAGGADNSVATQQFRVTVLTATAFTDRLVSGATPPRATHFLELRTRVAALRAREGLPPVRWTDPVLTVGVTPVKRIHLTELRNALNVVYDAAGRRRPTYTDGTVIAGVTAVKAVHVVDLRNAILAME